VTDDETVTRRHAVSAVSVCVCVRVTDDEAVTRRHAVPAVERVQSDSAERQQNIARHAAADPRLGSTPDPGVYSSLCISSN